MSKELAADDLTLPIKRTEGETLEDRLTANAYHNILPARYLRKDADGELVEQQEELFERVAKNVALAEAVYEANNQDVEITVTPAQIKPDHPRRDELAEEVFGTGTTVDDDVETVLNEYNVNKFAYETVVPELPEGVRDHVEETATQFQEQMERLGFMPNSPTLMNAGDELQQLSACIAGHAPVYTRDGLKRMDQIEPGDEVLTHNGRFKQVVDHWSNGEKSTVEMRRGINRGSCFDTQLTPDHEVYTEDGEWVRADEVDDPADPVFPGDVAFPETIELEQYTDRLKKEKEVAVDGGQVKLQNAADPRTPEFDQQNNHPAARISNDETLGWLFGLYLAEGDVYGSDLRFTIGTDETQLRERLIDSLEQTFGLPVSISESSHGKWVQIRVSSSFVADLFATVLGVGGDQKRIPEWVGQADESYKQALLDGLLDGDGTELDTAHRLVLANPTLVYEATLLARSLGYDAVFKLEKERDISSGPTSECYISTAGNPRLSNVARREAETTEVYDMEVADDHSFVVGDFVVHNCFVDSPEDDIDDIHQTAKEAASVFQCLTAETRVSLAGKGITSISDVEPGDRIVQRDGDDHRSQRVTETHAYHDSPVRRVVTEAGIELTGTPNHELLVDDEWTRIDEIRSGDTLSVRLGWIEAGERTPDLRTVAGGAQWSDQRTVSNDDILELYADGLSDHEIADRLDSSPSTIQRRRSLELGLDPNGDGGRSGGSVGFDEDRFDALHTDEKSDGEIAGELGVSTRSVARYRENNGLEANGEAVKTVTQPSELSPDLAELVGMWIGDGSKHEDGIRFHLNREETLEHADRLCRELFDVSLDWRWDEGCYEAIIHSHEIKRWWLANFGDAKPEAVDASVPDAVWEADRETIGAFLRGLFSTDGSLQKDAYPRLWSSSEALITGVQQLLVGVGIPAIDWEYDTDDREYYNVGPTGEQGLERFVDVVGFVDSRSETMAETIETIDSNGPSVGTVRGSTWAVPVETVADAGTDTVYDVTVADNHEYVASSVVSHNSGGGMGYAFWRLRPYGDAVGSTGGIASGPITFMRTYDQLCETIAQGGARRGAQMGVMRVSHPDVIQFIHAKNKDVSLANTLRLNDPDDFTHTSFAEALEEARDLIDDEGRVPEHLRNAVEGHLSNFNISVGITDQFMEAVKNDEEYTFTNPRTGEPHVATAETKELYDMFGLGEYVEVGEVLSVPANLLWEHIVEGAHENGEPGVIYLERVNKKHSFDVEEHPDHRILATNPCVTGDMEVQLADGSTQQIGEIAASSERVAVKTLADNEITTRSATAFKTKEDADILRVTTESGTSVRVTSDHEIRTDENEWREAGSLSAGDEIVGLTKLKATPQGPVQETTTETVASIHGDGTEDVYDLTVAETHNFFVSESGTESINVHNCGEQPLEEYEACNLGHINLSTLAAQDAPDWRVWSANHADKYDSQEAALEAFLEEAIDWEAFDERIDLGTRFLENVVTMSDFPVDEIEETVREMRKIGLGIMGLAQLYVQLGLEYGSEPANEIARQLMMHINHESKWASHELATERGTFGEWEKSKFADPTEYREWFEHHTGLDAEEWEDGFPIRNHNTTTIAPTGCVEENSLVSTDEGLLPIKDLDETTAEFEQWDEIEVGVSTDGGTKAATAVYDNGFADVRRIETEGGFAVASTPNHRFRTLSEDGEYVWKEADEFGSGDTILLQRDTFDGGQRARLDTTERENYHRNTDDDLVLPERMTPELAEFLGYFAGDGYVHEGVGVKLVVESDAEELDAYLRELGQSLFGVSPTVEDRETRHVLTFGGRHLPRYFEDNGWTKDDGNEGEGAASAFVPPEVLQGDEPIAKAFLRGLFEADGTASRKIELSTVSDTLASQVQTLLLSLGCVFVRESMRMDEREDHYGDRPRHTLRGANKREDKRFLDTVGFITKSTEFELTAQSYKNDVYPPAVVESIRAVDGYEDVPTDIKKRVNQSPINGSVSRKLVSDVERETGQTVTVDGRTLVEFYAATVDSVTERKAYTKDISVPSNNTYIANGFVTHNTTSMVGNTTGGCEPIYNVAYYKNVSDDVQGDEMLVEFDDYFLRVLEDNDIDVGAVKAEAQEQMANNNFDGVDGLTTVPDAIGELFVTTGDLSAKQHASVQTACQQGVDSAISKCLEAGTLVQTDSGVRRIESFAEETPEPGEFVDVAEDVTIDGVPVESQYYAGEKEATRVRVDNGTEIVGATESHKVLTPDGWKVIGNLEAGDYVVGRQMESHGDGNRAIQFSRGTDLVADGGGTLAAGGSEPSVHEKAVTLPSTMSPKLARFLGMYAADGSAIDDRYAIEISTSSERVRDEASDLFEELFGREPHVETDTRRGEQRDTVYGVQLNSKPVWEFVRALCSAGSYEKTVPREILQGGPEEKLAFVNGVTLDGYVSSQSLVVYGGMSADLAEGVAELLRSFGVPKIYVGRKWVDESDAYAYQVHVTNDAQELVTPIEPHKRVDRFDQRYRVYVPRDQVDKTEFDSRSSEYYAARNFEYRDRNYMFNTTAEDLGMPDRPPLYEVTEVEDVGTREMYDIELAGPHEYVVGGVVSHNTVNAPNDSTVEDAKEVFEYIYDHGGKGVTYYRDGTRSKQVLTTRAQNTEFADMDEGELVAQIEEVFGGIEGFLEHEDVQAALDEQVEELLASADGEREFAQKQSRPDVLHGITQRIDTGYGKLYVNINEDPSRERPFELFANIGNSGGFTASFTEALAKTISTALRSGVDPNEIADELQGIRSPKVAWDKGEQIQSIPDAIGTAMRRYLDGDVERAYPQQQTLEETAEEAEEDDAAEAEPETDGGGVSASQGSESSAERDQQSIIEAGESPECPDCGSLSLYYSEGCKTCESCGWSEC